jgi:hypothetical protein
VKINIGENGFSGVTYINLHENEPTSREAGIEIIKKYGSRIIWLESAGNREISFLVEGKKYTFDPNRIFTSHGSELSLKNYGNFSANALEFTNKFGKYLTDSLLKDAKVIVALHNNTAGGYSASSYLPGQTYASDSATVYIKPESDPDDFFYVTEKIFYDYLKNHGENVVLQNSKTVVDDGSLSVFCGYKNIRYINVEAEMGHSTEQLRMLETVRSLLKETVNLK